jgi:hypothetical protein
LCVIGNGQLSIHHSPLSVLFADKPSEVQRDLSSAKP